MTVDAPRAAKLSGGPSCTAAPGEGAANLRSEAYRHACEVRHVCSLGKRERDRYLYGDGTAQCKRLAELRGEAAAQRLIEDARLLFEQRRLDRAASHPMQPQLPSGIGAPGVQSGRPFGERLDLVQGGPGVGSFQHPANAGDSNPDRVVDSGVGA